MDVLWPVTQSVDSAVSVCSHQYDVDDDVMLRNIRPRILIGINVASVDLQNTMSFLPGGRSCIQTRQGQERKQESPANAKGTRDSSACMKAHCEQM